MTAAFALAVVGCAPSVVLPASTGGAAPTKVSGFLREAVQLRVTLADGSTAELETLITRPDQPGKVPVILLNHGSPRDAAERSEMSPTAYAQQAMSFARRGYGVAIVMRRGYGNTAEAYSESLGPCSATDYRKAAHVAADDVLAALRRLQSEPWVDRDHVLLIGQSAGGLSVTAAAATNPPGVVGVISFAGGRGSDAPDHVCQPERLVAEEHVLGSTGRVPSLWVYATNDHFFSPALATEMNRAYVSAGGIAQLVIAPAYGDDGHRLFSRAPEELWWRYVGPFLAERGLPTAVVHPRAPSSLPGPPGLSPAGETGFAAYCASESYEKAFATGGTAWSWAAGKRTRQEAAEAAVKRCTEHGHGCTVYAVGDELVGK